MSLRNSNGGPRPMNAPPADAFSYRPVQQQQQQPPTPQQQGQPGQGPGQPPALGQQQQPQQPQQQQPGGFTKPPPLSLEQSKAVARTHYTALKGWLTNEGALSSGSTRTNARDKLTRLTRQQFQELSTDVYDELMRRIEDSSTPTAGQQPFLAVRPDFHPKRNQARQKLATLPLSRFRDLASDVYFELDRRYPEFGEEDDNAGGQAYSTPQTHFSPHSRTGSHASSQQAAALTSPPPPTNLNARRAPTPTSATSQSSALPVGNDVVVPNKSTMLVEDEPMRSPPVASASHSLTSPTSATSPPIPSPTGSLNTPRSPSPGSAAQARPNGAPYGFGASHSASSLPRPAPPVPTVHEEDERDEAYGDERGEALASPPASRAPYGLGSSAGSGAGLGLGQQGQGQGHAQGAGLGLGNSRASEVSSNGTSSRFFGGYAGSNAPSEVGGGVGGRRSWENEAAADKVRADYEYKLARLQNRVAELEREGASAASASASSGEGERRVREQLEDERRRWEQRFEEQQTQLRSLQRDHDSLRARGPSPSSSSTRSAGTSGLDAQVRARLHEAEELAAEMRGEVSSLVDEVRHASERAEELQREVERERDARDKAEKEAREWKDRWQAAKLELRNVKATSMLFTSSISVDADWLPASSDGLINDTSIAAFQTSIDDLLQAARSKEPSSVLPTARAVVQACQKVDNDVQAIPPSRVASLPLSEQDLVNSLKVKINATLSNLLTACKNHATGYGVSPVSLLDAAASHLAATVVELVRILKIRRTTGPSSSSTGRGGALDPSSAFGMRTAAAREPMPPLREDVGAGSRLSQGGLDDAHSSLQGLSISVPSVETTPTPTPMSPAPPPPPAKEQPPQPPQPSYHHQQQQSRSRISGGVSSIFGSGGSVKSALGAIGLGSDRGTKRNSGGSVRSRSDAGTLAGASAGARSSVAESFSQQQQPFGGDAHGPLRPGFNGAGSRDSYGGRQSLESDGSGYGARGQQQQGYGGGYDGQQQQQQYGGPQDEPQQYHHGGYSAQGSSQQYGAYSDEQRRDEYGEHAYDGGAGGEMQQGQERDPEELRAYIENQTEAIVHSIQSLLSAIRSGAQSSELQENLTQIITIVSSIVAISQEALPRTLTPAEEDEGSAILQDLTTHCDQLSEMQSADHAAPGAFNKQTKQAMAAASFGVAKSLKQLNALLSSAAGDEP
ncbi:hypothetical protein JCM9279_004317 [Rhodotorula babjevae]